MSKSVGGYKICSKCKERKETSLFYKDKKSADGFKCCCKRCANEMTKKYNEANREKVKAREKSYKKKYNQINKDKIKKQHAKYAQENRDKVLNSKRKYYEKNAEKIKSYQKEYYKKNKDYVLTRNAKYQAKNKRKIAERRNVYLREKYKEDLEFKLTNNLRGRLYKAIKADSGKKSSDTYSLIGCTVAFLAEYLEDMFQDGMTWNNHGEWHIDHIRPCALFDLTDPEQQKKCFHYTNLQPLWAEENMKKNKKQDYPLDNWV